MTYKILGGEDAYGHEDFQTKASRGMTIFILTALGQQKKTPRTRPGIILITYRTETSLTDENPTTFEIDDVRRA